MHHLKDFLTIALRAIAVLVIAWFFGHAPNKSRLYVGYVTAIFSGMLTFTYLDPLFSEIGLALATVALYILAILGTTVGMAIGVLLPKPCIGGVLGATSVIIIGSLLSPATTIVFPISGPIVAFTGIIISTKFLDTTKPISWIHTIGTILVGGAVTACLAYYPLFPYIMKIILSKPSPTHSLSSDSENEIPNLGLIWILGCVLVTVSQIYFGNIMSLLSSSTDSRLSAQPKETQSSSNQSSYQRRESSIPTTSSDSYNMFNPANLPPRLAEYANIVYHACEDLGNFFGFQDSSVRNQAEHLLILLSNHRRYMTILAPQFQPPSPIHALHKKVFMNYVKWCRAIGVRPQFSKLNSMCTTGPPALVSKAVDLVLFFCIWGEASNFRHVPECLWFLYHKMMEEYCLCEGYTQTRSLYAGHFVDNVITPMFDVVSKSMKSKQDHQEKRNYDDFNEFFWSPNCLKYHYSNSSITPNSDIEHNLQRYNGELSHTTPQPISEGLAAAPKTFLEKRSWLRAVLAFSRILEWHLITFFLLAVIAFSRELVWGWVYSLQVASGVFWLINVIAICWGLLEVWADFPGIHLAMTSIFGSVFTLSARFVILVYQTLYLMWTFGPHAGVYFGIEADGNFWWWQYIWLSLLCMAPYIIESIFQFVPSAATYFYTCQNDFVQSFLNILYPLSRLYVGKEVHESVGRTAKYVLFWITLIVWKLLFSYMFEVYSMVLPSLELTDDYLNYPDQSFAEMSMLLILRWLPQFIVYLIDMIIWYSVWQAVAGTWEGFIDHLGNVRSMKDIREKFSMVPEHFCRKMLSADAGSRRGSSASFSSRMSLSNPNLENTSLLGSDPHKLQSYVNNLLDVRIQKWVMFSAAWNEIIDALRQEDIISNSERDNLRFSRFDGFSQAVYLPAFQTAGVMEDALTALEESHREIAKVGPVTDDVLTAVSDHVIMSTAVSEIWELGNYLLLQLLGKSHNDDVVAVLNLVLKWTKNKNFTEHVRVEDIRNVTKNFVGLIKILQKGLKNRKPAPKKRSLKPKMEFKKTEHDDIPKRGPGGFRRVVSSSSLFSSNMSAAKQAQSQTVQKMKEAHAESNIDALRDQVRDSLRNTINSFKSLIRFTNSDKDSRDVSDRITFVLSMENGFFWDDNYASDQLDEAVKKQMFGRVLSKVYGLVACHPDDVEPKSKEARRRLTFFVNSLFMDIPVAPSIQDMLSWNVLTPFYSEDVTYTKKDLETRRDALGVSTLLYLQTLYKSDWINFLERMGLPDDEKIWQKKYVNETRTWASLRSQTLSRTVNGMMYYEKALRLLANLERLDEDSTNNLLGEKFGYVVACQVYGNMKKNQDSKADDIDQLMHRFPHLRVAYIDNVRLNREGKSIFYSVLVKSNEKGGIEEVFRVRLPGNPVIGEGKPENQNHAIIFTRGEFIQTIDMNQEGYFEEALKMRNALQEFNKNDGRHRHLPTTILGLREHIFTGSVSSLANYMALQETSFVTLGQRVLTNPLCIRLHYGHPDVFDKIFFMARGGISKASKGINLSEDIFAGYNNVIRGGQVAFKEYIQVGKGRDVGMSQIYKFEAKLSQGAGEQSLSRDVYRMSNRLDFFRLLSYYYGGIGHYFTNVLTVLTVYIVIYLMLILAVFNLEKIGDRMITPMGAIQMLLGGLGLLQTIPLFATLGVERGWLTSLREIFHVFVTGGPLHFMFHIQTKAKFMSQTILVGGAQYRATGRGFVTQHTPMDEQFRFFASSHLYLGVELGMGLILMAVYTEAGQYFGRTWSLWLASISFLASPFWFNPLSFEWPVVTSDYDLFLRWMGGKSGDASKSWSVWWSQENSFYASMPVSSKIFVSLKSILYLFIAAGIRNSNLFKKDISLYKPMVSVPVVMLITICCIVLIWICNRKGVSRQMSYPLHRAINILLGSLLIASVVTIFVEDVNCLRYALSAYYGIGAICLLGLITGVKRVKPFYFLHDIVVGHIIFIPLFIMAALQVPHYIQTWLLYHNALSNDVVVSDILRYARKNQEAMSGSENEEDLMEQINELRRMVMKQEQMLKAVGAEKASRGSDSSADAVANLINPAPTYDSSKAPTADIHSSASVATASAPAPVRPTAKRVMSLSNLDVWGSMAMGEDASSTEVQDLFQSNQEMARTVPGFRFTQPDELPPR